MNGGDEDAIEPWREATEQGENSESQQNQSDSEAKQSESEAVGNSVEETAGSESVEEGETLSVDELVEQLELATRKAEENWEKLLRTQADMDNLRRRTTKDVENAHKFGLEKFVRELLPVLDSLELGIRAAVGDSPEVAKLREGSELTLKLFRTVIEKFSIAAVDPVGEMFNPEKHQAMSMQPTADAEPNSIVSVYQKGYLLNERLIRPAMVIVAQALDENSAAKIDEQA